MLLTRRGVALLVGAAALWVIGRALAVRELYVLAVAALVLVVAAAVSVALASATLSVRRTVSSPRLLWGGAGRVTIELRNDAPFPTALLLVSDERSPALAGPVDSAPPRWVVPGIRSGRHVNLDYTVTGGARGRHRIGPLTVRVRDPFAVVQRVRRYRGTDELLVYPRVEPLGPGLDAGRDPGSRSSAARRLLNAGDEFHTLREYVTGDDLRHVHWPSTARRGRVMVRQQEQPSQAQATVFLDTRGESGPWFERAVSAAASLVWHLADRDVQLRLVLPDDGGAAEVAGWDIILDRLAQAAPTAPASRAGALLGLHRGGGGLFVAVIGPPPGGRELASHPDVRALLTAGRTGSPRVALVVEPAGLPRRVRESSGAGAWAPSRRAQAQELADVLAHAGWRAVTLPQGATLADRWEAVVGSRTSRAAPVPGRTA